MRLHLFVAVLISGLGYSQTILNSESLLNHSADKLTTQLNLSVDWESGNENTFATFNQILIGKKKGKQLWRLIIGHDYEDDEGEIVANDWSGQLRLNHYVSAKNSIYGFMQSQNIRVLQMNHRYLFGGGYRHSIYANESQYFDLAAGLFYEDEEYPELQTDKVRFNINGFVRVKIFENLFFNCVSYFKSTLKIQVISVFLLSPKSILSKTSLPCQLLHKIATIQHPICSTKRTIFYPSWYSRSIFLIKANDEQVDISSHYTLCFGL